jgi:hypothetical protein
MRTKRPWFETLTRAELNHILNTVADSALQHVFDSFRRNVTSPECTCLECKAIAIKLGLRKTTL